MNKLQKTLISLLNGMKQDLKNIDSVNFVKKNKEFSKLMNWVRTYLNIPKEETLPADKARDDMLALLQIKRGSFTASAKNIEEYEIAILATLQEAFQWINRLIVVSREDVETELKKAIEELFKAAKSQHKFNEANARFLKLELMFRYKHNLSKTNDAIDKVGNSCVFVITALMHNQQKESLEAINDIPAEIEEAKKFIDSHN